MARGGRRHYVARAVGIETIIIVLGAAIVIAIAVGVSRGRRKAAGTQAPKSVGKSTVRRQP
jgi:hypothetical protein